MPQFFGRATIRVNGEVIESKEGATLDIGGTARKTVKVGRTVGYVESTAEAVVEFETALRPGMSLDRIRRFAGGTVIFECDTGQRYVINDAFTSDTPKMKDGEQSAVTIKMEGPAAEEVA